MATNSTCQHQRGTAPYFVASPLLSWNVSQVPHTHDFKLLDPNLHVTTEPTVNQGLTKDIWAMCKVCFGILTIQCTNLSMTEQSVKCSQGMTHHFHWSVPKAPQPNANDTPVGASSIPPDTLTVSCCLCAFSALFQWTYPAIPHSTLLLLERTWVSKTKTQTNDTDLMASWVAMGLCIETLIIYIDNVLMGNLRPINATNKIFQKRIGMEPATEACFKVLGFQFRDPYWHPPQALEIRSRDNLVKARTQLELKSSELYKQVHPGQEHPRFKFPPAQPTIGHGLGATVYPKRASNHSSTTTYLEEQTKPVTPSYGVLGCIPDMDDKVISWVFRLLSQEDPGQGPQYLDALHDLSLGRPSDTLRDIVDTQRVEGHFTATDIQNAYRFFEADPTSITDYQLVCLYQSLVIDKVDQTAQAFSQLQVLAAARKSVALEEFMHSGSIERLAKQEAIHSGDSQHLTRLPVGLQNIGNTCYLNSLLQYYFTLLPLRKAILDTDPWNSALVMGHRDGQRLVGKREIEYALTFVGRMRELFSVLENSKQSSVRPDKELARQALTSAPEQLNTEEPPKTNTAFVKIGPKVITPPPEESSPSPSALLNSSREPSAMQVDEEPASTNSAPPSETSIADANLPSSVLESDQESHPSQKKVRFKVADNEPEIRHITDQETTTKSSRTPPLLPVRRSTRLNKNQTTGSTDTESTTGPTSSNQMMFGRQQDVSECMENILRVFETALQSIIPHDPSPTTDQNKASSVSSQDSGEERPRGSSAVESVLVSVSVPEHEDPRRPEANLIRRLFYGVSQQSLNYLDAALNKDVENVKLELFNHVLIQAAQGNDLYDGLDAYFGQSTVSFAGTDAVRQVYIDHLPSLLHIQIQRVQFNIERGAVYKNNAYVPFDPVLYLDRYMADQQPALQDRKQRVSELQERVTQARSDIEKLVHHPACSQTVSQLLEETIAYLKSKQAEISTNNQPLTIPDVSMNLNDGSETTLKDSPSTPVPILSSEEYNQSIANLEVIQAAVEEKKSELTRNIEQWRQEIKGVYADLQNVDYHAHAVFMHRGEASFGHYWVYIFDHKHHRWLKYNDEIVTHVPDSEVFGDTTGSNANPYLIVYARRSQLDDLVSSD
ncbi:ubiquitin-specific protease ubp2 [Dispira simplex]|nr:ubiquitin-specific protease ubp2 [Dispira simplex]